MAFSDTLPLMGARPELASVTLFHARDKAYTVDDAIAFGAFRGLLDDAINETLELAAAENLVDPDEGAIQKAAEAFRYERELITAGETEQWLAARGMTTDDFGGWLYQRVCADSANATADEVPDDFADLLRIHLWLSGGMDRLAVQMSRRIAAAIESGADAGTHAANEATFERLVAEQTTDAARARQLSAMRMPLTRIDLDLLELESLAAAREAVMCVRNDRSPLKDVAREAGFSAQRKSLWIGDTEDALAHQLLAAGAGGVVGPVEAGKHYCVYQVIDRREPTVDDDAIRSRVDAEIVNNFFDELVVRHVKPAL